MPRKFTNLVFQGGGSAGVAYGGALAALEKLSAEGQFDLAAIRRVAGSSIGAIAALIVSLRYSAKEIVTIMRNLDFDALTGEDAVVVSLKKTI